jgi:hypothetical protein
MKTLFTISAILLLTFTGYAQQIEHEQIIHLDQVDLQVQKDKPEAQTVYSIVREIEVEKDFDYREFLRMSRNENGNYILGVESFEKVELLKMLRKGARKSESVTEFKNYLDKTHPLLTINLEKSQLKTLYQKLRVQTLDEYLENWVTYNDVAY